MMGFFSSRYEEVPSDPPGSKRKYNMLTMQRVLRGLSRSVYEVSHHLGLTSKDWKWRLESKDLPSLRRVGRGQSGFVYETVWRGKKHARKDFPMGSYTGKSVFKDEANLLFDLDHPNIAKCYGYTVGKSCCSLLQEYVEDNLQNIIRKRIAKARRSMKKPGSNVEILPSLPFEVPEAEGIISQISSAMEYLHDHQIVHGDLKSMNVLVQCPEQETRKMIMKLADFGLVESKKCIRLEFKWTGDVEAFMWKAPEVFSTVKMGSKDLGSDDRLTDCDTDSDSGEETGSSVEFWRSRLAKADVYSFGLLCAHILSGKLESPNVNRAELKKRRTHDFTPELPPTCPGYLKSLIYRCLKREALSRPTFSDIRTVLQVRAEMTLEDPHIEGKFRLCKVIHEKIIEQVQKKSNGVSVVGLYGMGGTGKTTICKALCNHFFSEFNGRVCHVELGRVNEEVLLQNILEKLSNLSQKQLSKFNFYQLSNVLKERKFNFDAPIFLALDNMSNSIAAIKQVSGYLLAKFPPGSIILVTSRSKESLMHLEPHINENECMKMPELKEEEAWSLFIKSSEGKIGDEQFIHRCVRRCLWKDDHNETNYYYHPLGLDVLGRELAQWNDFKKWEASLDKIDEDILNLLSGNNPHPVFCILRKSFDALSSKDQMFFMDLVLFLHDELHGVHTDMIEWLGFMHSMHRRHDNVKEVLKRLDNKSLLRCFEDACGTSISVHDLWRAFCVAETKSGGLQDKRWIYEMGTFGDNSLYETCQSWENVERMVFLDFESRNLQSVNFSLFPNVKALKITMAEPEHKLLVDLSGLNHLQSLDISGSSPYSLFHNVVVDFRALAKKPTLRLHNMLQELKVYGRSSAGTHGSNSLMMLCTLHIGYCGGMDELYDFESLIWLQTMSIHECEVKDVSGLNNLINLESLTISRCKKLERLPNIHKLTNLESLVIVNCPLLRHWDHCKAIQQPSPQLVPNLEILRLENWVLRHWDHCKAIQQPSPQLVPNLEILRLENCGLADLTNIGFFQKLKTLVIVSLPIKELPNLGNFPRLKTLSIRECENLMLLENSLPMNSLLQLDIVDCSNLTTLLDHNMSLSRMNMSLFPRDMKRS